MAAAKWATHGAIEDPGRVEQELASVGADAAAHHIDADYVTRVFGDPINATEAIEYSRFADWKLTPSHISAGSPDLSASRSAIDALNQTMLTQIVANWDLLHWPACAAQVDAARSGATWARQLDSFINRRCRWRRAHIVRPDLLISHQFLKLSFGCVIADLC